MGFEPSRKNRHLSLFSNESDRSSRLERVCVRVCVCEALRWRHSLLVRGRVLPSPKEKQCVRCYGRPGGGGRWVCVVCGWGVCVCVACGPYVVVCVVWPVAILAQM